MAQDIQPPAGQSAHPLQFSLGTLLLLMTLAAVCLAIVAAVPPLGIAVTAIAIVALFRTLAAGRLNQRVGLIFAVYEKIWEFAASCGIVLGALLAGALVLVGVSCINFLILFALTELDRSAGPVSPPVRLIFMILMAACSLSFAFIPFSTVYWILRVTWPRLPH